MAERPMNLAYDPPPGVSRSTGKPEPPRMMIYDDRPLAGRLSLDSEGLAVVKHNSAVRDFYDEDELRRVYYPEAEPLVPEVSGATRVLVFDHTVRRRVWGGVDRSAGTPRQPVTAVHNDYTINSGPQRVRDLMGEEAEELLRHRFEIVNVWRPIRGPPRHAPPSLFSPAPPPLTRFFPSRLGLRGRTRHILRRQHLDCVGFALPSSLSRRRTRGISRRHHHPPPTLESLPGSITMTQTGGDKTGKGGGRRAAAGEWCIAQGPADRAPHIDDFEPMA